MTTYSSQIPSTYSSPILIELYAIKESAIGNRQSAIGNVISNRQWTSTLIGNWQSAIGNAYNPLPYVNLWEDSSTQ